MFGTVYLIQQPRINGQGQTPNLQPASKFGELKVLLESGEYPSIHPERCLVKLNSRLANFNAETDYLLWANGDPLSVALTVSILIGKGVRSFRWLRYDRKIDPVTKERMPGPGYYTPVSVNLDELDRFINETPCLIP